MFRLRILFLCYLTLWFCSCRNDEPSAVNPFLGQIESIAPSTGSSGDTIRISGRKFGMDPSAVRAFVNGKYATIVDLNDSSIRIIVPVLAGTGLVSLAGESGGTTGPMFQFLYRARVEWYAGTPSSSGYSDGAALQSKFNYPLGLSNDQLGNIYVADGDNHRIRRISPGGTVSTFAGDGQPGHQDGTASTARFNFPTGLSYDPYANELYVADRFNHCVRKINQQGVVYTVAGVAATAGFVDAPGTSARFNQPVSVVF
ncbi:MAG: IPT/TIG domain-containing protein, partial [Bacteroidota bacterium]